MRPGFPSFGHKAQVRLVPCTPAAGLKRPGALAAASPALVPAHVDAAFSEAVDQQVARLFAAEMFNS